jgi:hypothetical protein
MEKNDQIIGYIYSLFGRVINYVQIIEKGIMNSIILKKLENNITSDRYHELYFEYYKKTTGQLLREFNEIIPDTDGVLFERFHELRDYLSHHFWWEINLEFEDNTSIDNTINELNNYMSTFVPLVDYLNNFRFEFEKKHNLQINHEFDKVLFLTSLKRIKKYRILNKNENVIEIFAYKQNENEIIPIFHLEDDTFWTIAESGLTQYFLKIIDSLKIQIKDLNGIFPIKQFNPRPKINSAWNYSLLLKKQGLKIVVKLNENNNPFNWNVENTVANKGS